MGKGIYWQVFENTGLIEAYLAYCKTEEVTSDSVESEASDSKCIDGEE